MNAAPLAFFQNMGFWEWVFLISLLYFLYSRVGARNLGRSVGSAFNQSQPPPPSPSQPSSASLSQCYQTLEVPESASLDQIRESYKNLVKVWHPDRFQHDPKLREKAEQKLKEINTAYDRLIKARN